ncbi:MAG: nucleoside hydrolase [Lachnospiraceae bacterium]|nr:nucleoside hydrolase [Lachnospiraceae bacterium]
MRRIEIITMVMVLSFFTAVLSGCGNTADEDQTKYQPGPNRKVIIDTDTGADDACAIIMAARSSNLDILGVTTLAGNVELEQSTKNALAALEIAGCDAPVYGGSTENIMGESNVVFSVFGKDGMGEADLIHPVKAAEQGDAVDFILDTVRKNPDEIEIIALGPTTNIAKAIQKDPETMRRVKRIWSMGTAGQGPGNATPVAEFNVYGDPEAYKIMLDSGINITVVGLDMCGKEAQWTNAQFEELSGSGEIGEFVTKSFAKIRDFYAMNGSADSVMNCDTLAMTCVIYPDFITDTVQCHGSCIVEPGETFGEVLFYKKGHTYDVATNNYDYNVTLVSGVRASDYFNLFLDTL